MDLKDRLVDLAEDVADVQPPVGLWDTEVRRRARARRDTVVVALVATLAIVGLLVGDWRASRQPSPANPGRETSMPDRVWRPSPWLPGTDAAGELGALTALLPTERGGWLGNHPGIVGLAAATGEYRFLDLPGYAGEGCALSSDGRRVAYWAWGTSSGQPHDRAGAVTAIAVYDTVTGAVQRAEIATVHGIDPSDIAFVDPDTVVAFMWQHKGGYGSSVDDQSFSFDAPPLVWHLDRPEAEELSLVSEADGLMAAGDGRLWLGGARGKRTFLMSMAESGDQSTRVVLMPFTGNGTVGNASPGVISSRGDRLAVMGSPHARLDAPAPITVYFLTAGRPCCQMSRVPLSRNTWAVTGWLPDGDLVVLGTDLSAKLGGSSPAHLYSLDVETGARRELVTFDGDVWSASDWIWATGLLGSRAAAGVRPPSPWDPRVTTGLVLVVVLGAALVVRRLRRRRG